VAAYNDLDSRQRRGGPSRTSTPARLHAGPTGSWRARSLTC